MNIRTTPNRLIRWAAPLLKRLNDRHPWSHNHHFHPWILGSLPPRTGRALDVGCGRGDLVAALAGVAGRVDGIDPDQEMAHVAATRFEHDPAVHIGRRTLAEHAAPPHRHGTYDAITMVASLHHMDLVAALTDARELLSPGGRLLVVTLTDPVSTADQIWDLLSALTNPLIGLVKHPQPVREAPKERPIPMKDPTWSIDVLRREAGRILPGARIRRREGFRVTLRWEKPGEDLAFVSGGGAAR